MKYLVSYIIFFVSDAALGIKVVRSGLIGFSFCQSLTFWIVWPCGVAVDPVQILNPHIHLGIDGSLWKKKKKTHKAIKERKNILSVSFTTSLYMYRYKPEILKWAATGVFQHFTVSYPFKFSKNK